MLAELNQLQQKKSPGILNPLDPIKSDFWGAVKLDPPRALLRDERALGMVYGVARRTDQVTEMIRSREAFRTANRALNSYLSELEKYDNLLNTFLTELLNALNELQPMIRKAHSKADKQSGDPQADKQS